MLSETQIKFENMCKKYSKEDPSKKFLKDMKNTSNKNYIYWEKYYKMWIIYLYIIIFSILI